MFFSKLKTFTRDYFTLTSRERRGALVLAFIIMIQISVLGWLHFIKSPMPPSIEIYNLAVAAFPEEKENNLNNSTSRESGKEESKPRNLFAFDPNTISNEVGKELGLSEKQIAVIHNFLNKGGRFREKSDFAKMYCISESEYEILEPYILIKSTELVQHSDFKKTAPVKKPQVILELNTADTLQLQELPMVGPGRARMIYRYREKLGGFYSVEQLREVFTIDSTVFNAIVPHVKVDPTKIRKFSINGDSLIHPYLGRKQAAIILAYRKQHGNFKEIKDLRKVSLPDNQLPDKIGAYLTFE